MRQKKSGQRSSYMVRLQLEQLFDLPPKAASAAKVSYKKYRYPVVPVAKLKDPQDHRLATFLADW